MSMDDALILALIPAALPSALPSSIFSGISSVECEWRGVFRQQAQPSSSSTIADQRLGARENDEALPNFYGVRNLFWKI